MQRFWLTATQLGIQYQPEMTPLIFANYTRDGKTFTQVHKAEDSARKLKKQLGEMISEDALERSVFMGRVGYGAPPQARSTRLSLSDLISQSKLQPLEAINE
jgi:hypothetical protein